MIAFLTVAELLGFKSVAYITSTEPSTAPTIVYDGELCFSVNSSIAVHIDYTITTTTIEYSGNLTGPGPVCIEDPFPNECEAFNVTASATNAIGTSDQDTQNFISDGCQGIVTSN